MGLGKLFSAVGTFSFYSKDVQQFATELGRRFGVNIGVSSWSLSDTQKEDATRFEKLELGYHDTWYMEVILHDYDWRHPRPENTYYAYNLDIPFNVEGEEELTLSMGPNGVFQLWHIPFSNAWCFFLEDISGENDHYFNSHEEVVERIFAIRAAYIPLLQKFGCSEALILPEANYKTESRHLDSCEPGQEETLAGIKKALQELDGVRLFDLLTAVKEKQQFDDLKPFHAGFTDAF